MAPVLFLLCACVGPPAPDVELCRDVITRLCAEPVCSGVTAKLNTPAMGCEAELQRRSGCDVAEFAFTTPTRDRVLECRLPLVRESNLVVAHPPCEYVDETFRNCPDLVGFLGGTP